jgi:uncharacterized protein (TIGR00251 family)
MRLTIRVIPRASRTEFAGERNGARLVRLAAPPVDGAANDELIDFLARTYHVPRRAVRIVRGERSRIKLVEIDGL